jgi:SOS response regulatory protein OraA/RecX
VKNKNLIDEVLKLLSKRDYSEKEIIEKIPLMPSSILNKLKKEKLIDDFSLSEKIAESLKNKGKGYFYILKQLEKRKINDNVIEKFKKEYDFVDELERCKKLVEKLKNKKTSAIIMNLKSKGFPDEIIEKVIEIK